MAPLDSALRKQVEEPAPLFRSAPHNIEAEQALLGAILVNNEAFYRVSDFLKPEHFFEPIHQKIYQLARDLIRAGKIATPVTLKTFLDADLDIGGMTLGQYLARLAAEATTIINAEDYGHTIYDLSIRRALILVGEDMVNVAFDAPVDFSPRNQIEDAERKLYELAETGRYDGGFQLFRAGADHRGRHGGARLSARRQTVRPRHRPRRSRPHDGRLAAVRLDHPRRPSRHGQDRARHQYRLQHRRAWRGEVRADGHTVTVNGGIVGFFSLEMSAEQLATRIIAEQTGIPSNQIRRGGISEADFETHQGSLDRIAEPAVLRRRDRRPVGGATRRARAPAQAPARPRSADHRLPATAARLDPALGGKPRAGNHRDHHQAQGAGERTQRADPGAVAALASGRKPRRQASAALGLA